MNNRVAAPPHAFPPGVVVAVKALACELPHRVGKPLSRFSLSELRREVVGAGLVASISGTTVWRWLSQDALHPWRHRTWNLPPGSCVSLRVNMCETLDCMKFTEQGERGI